MYLSYGDYQRMGGSAPFEAFEPACFRACKRIDHITHQRIHALPSIPYAVQMATFEAINALIHQRTQESEGIMTSFTNDGMSISYSTQTKQEREQALNDLIITCLQGEMSADGSTALLYAGVS